MSGSRRRSSAGQELPEQSVIAIPLTLTVQRNHEQTRCLQPAQLLRRIRSSEDRIAQRTTEVIEHCRAPQEPLHVVGLVRQRLAVQIVGHEAVVTGHRQRRRAALGSRSVPPGKGRPATLRFARSPRRRPQGSD